MWTIFNSSVLTDIINVFLLYHSFKLTWSATDRQLVGDQSPTARRPVASSCKEVPTRSATSRGSVGNQSPISRRPTVKPSYDCDRFESWSRRGRRAVAVYSTAIVKIWIPTPAGPHPTRWDNGDPCLTEVLVNSCRRAEGVWNINQMGWGWCQEKSYPGEIVSKRNRTQHKWVRFLWKNRTLGTISPEISYPGYHFSRDIVPYFNNVALSYLVL